MNADYKPYWGMFVDEYGDVFRFDMLAKSKEDFIEKAKKAVGKKITKHNITVWDDGEIIMYGWEKAHETTTDP